MRHIPLQLVALAVMFGAAACFVPGFAEAAGTASGYSFEQYLNIRSASGGSLSPDGDRIAFLANITGVNQVWMVGAASGWPDQITFYPDRVQWVSWSPTGEWLAFGKDAGGDERTQIYLASPDGSRIEPLTSNPKAIHAFGGWSHDGTRIAYASNERAEAYFDIYVMDVASRKATRVLTHDGSNAVAAWSPDDRRLVISRSNASQDNDLFLLDLQQEPGAPPKLPTPTLLTQHDGAALYTNVNWPPGYIIYVATDQGRDFRNVAAIDVTAPKVTFVESSSRDVETLRFSRDGRRVVISHNDGGYSTISLRDGGIKGRELPPPLLPRGVAGSLEFSKDGRLLLMRVEGSTEPGDLWLHDTREGTTSRVTHSSLAGIPRESFSEPEVVSFRSFDDLEVPALLYKPSGAGPSPAGGGALPAILLIHGGPESQSRPSFSQVNQFFVSRGYVVLAPNIRGSTGYGRRYQTLDDVRRRGDAIKDVAAAARYLKGSGVVDPRRIAVMGGSYGGYMTLAALTFHPDLWAAGVDIVGISSFKSFLKNTGAWRVNLRASEYGDPVADAEFLESISPLGQVDRIRAPLMVIQGANDPRVPRSEAEQIVASLKSRGMPVEYLLFPDEGHGVVKLPNRIKAYTAVADFLDRHLKAGEGQGSSTTR